MKEKNENNMHETPEEPHIGNLIKLELKRQGRSVAWLARQLQFTRQNLYRTLEHPWIHTDTLLRVCNILDHDFFALFSSHWHANRHNATKKQQNVNKNNTN